MKKFYIFTLALGVAATSFAAAPVKNAVKSDLSIKKSGLELTAVNAVKAEKPLKANENWEDIGEGVFVDPIVAGMYGQPNDPIPVTIQKSGTKYRVVNPWPSMRVENYLIIDTADPEMVTVPLQLTGINDSQDGDTYIESVSQIVLDNGGTKADFLAQYGDQNIYLENNVIYFDANSVYFNWPNASYDPSNPYSTNPDSWYSAQNAQPGYLQLPGGQVVSEWEEMGTATMNDGIVAPFLGEDTNTTYQVVVEKNVKKNGFYRLVKPFARIWEDSKNIVINASDPNNVLIEEQSTGIPLQTEGMMYILSRSSMYDSLEQFLAASANNSQYVITLANNVINIPGNAVYAYFPQYDAEHVYAANSPVACTITLPEPDGIQDVNIDNNAPVEYYNLQGIRVANPEKGQLVIARQGNKAVKYIVK